MKKEDFIPVNFYRNSFKLQVKGSPIVYEVYSRNGYSAKCDLREYLNVQGIMVVLNDIESYVVKED